MFNKVEKSKRKERKNNPLSCSFPDVLGTSSALVISKKTIINNVHNNHPLRGKDVFKEAG